MMQATSLPPPGKTARPVENDIVITIDNLGFEVGARRNKGGSAVILSGVDLTVWDNEFVAIVGPSGCGKSTLLNFVAGLQPVQSGRIDIARTEGREPALGYVFQQHGLLPWRTVQQNVELGLEVAGMPALERKRQARKMLGEMGLSGFEQHYPGEISGGMRQRVALARTLVTRPGIVLMDEPFGALDAQTRILMQEMFGRYWEQHRVTVLFVTHDIDEALFLADRVIVMGARPGRIVAQHEVDIGRPRDFRQMRHSPRYGELYDGIWRQIERQAQQSMRGRS